MGQTTLQEEKVRPLDDATKNEERNLRVSNSGGGKASAPPTARSIAQDVIFLADTERQRAEKSDDGRGRTSGLTLEDELPNLYTTNTKQLGIPSPTTQS